MKTNLFSLACLLMMPADSKTRTGATPSGKDKDKPAAAPKPPAAVVTPPTPSAAPKLELHGVNVGDFTIQKNVPVPALRAARKSKYPLGNMEVNDSFFIPGAKQSSVSSTVSAMGKSLKRKFIAREDTVEGKDAAGETVKVSGVRVWRVADATPATPPANPPAAE